MNVSGGFFKLHFLSTMWVLRIKLGALVLGQITFPLGHLCGPVTGVLRAKAWLWQYQQARPLHAHPSMPIKGK